MEVKLVWRLRKPLRGGGNGGFVDFETTLKDGKMNRVWKLDVCWII